MIMRMWRGRAAPDKAAAYARHFADIVVPKLKQLAGHRGAWLLTRAEGARAEVVALTLWESLDSVRAFTGDDTEVSIVDPVASALFLDYDNFARHYEVAHGSVP